MAKITYANKQVAIDPNNPAANEQFVAGDANEIKASVNALYDIISNITLVDGLVSGPTLIATSSTTVTIETFTQNKALVYNNAGFQYTIAAGTADQSFTGTPDATFSKGCIIQGNGTTISLKQGVAAGTVIYPTPDTGYTILYSFLLTTTGITDISSQLAAYTPLADFLLLEELVNSLAASGGTTTLTFNETDLVSMGDGFYKLPLVLGAGKVILGIKIEIDGGDTFQKSPAEFINDEILNFDTNATQTITIITN